MIKMMQMKAAAYVTQRHFVIKYLHNNLSKHWDNRAWCCNEHWYFCAGKVSTLTTILHKSNISSS